MHAEWDDDALAAGPVAGGALLYNPGLRGVSNSVRAGMGSGLDASGLSALISRSADFPSSYAALGFDGAPAPQRVLPVGSAHTSAAAQAKAQRQARGEEAAAAATAATGAHASATSQLMHALPLRPVPPVSSGAALQGQDKPLHRRLVSFAINQHLGGGAGAGAGAKRDTASAANAGSTTTASASSATPVAIEDTSAASSDDADAAPRPGVNSEERGKALDAMIALITTISSLKRWKNKSLQSVDRSLDALRMAAESFMTQTNPVEWGAKISEGLSLSAAPALAMKQSREARAKIQSNDKIIKSIETKVEDSIASAGGSARHGAAAAPSTHPSMYLQGDVSCYTTLKYLQRISNSFHLDLLTLVKRFFDTTEQTGNTAAPAHGQQGKGYVGKMAYIHLLLLIHKQLMPLTPAAEAVRIVLQDWEQDSRAFGVRIASGPPRAVAAPATSPRDSSPDGSTGIVLPSGELAFSLPAFHSCLFQLVDHWTLGCDVSEYVSLLAGLFSKITQPNADFSPRAGGDRRKVVFKPLTVEYSRALEAALTGGPEHRKRKAGAVGGLAGLMGLQPGFQKGTKSIKGVAASPRPALASPMGSPRSTLNARRASGTGSQIGSGGSSSEGSKRNSGIGLGGSAVASFLASHGIEQPPSASPSPHAGGESSGGSSAMHTPNRSREGSALAMRGTRPKASPRSLAIDAAANGLVEYVPSDDENADHLDVTADGRSRSRTDRVPRPMPETPMAASAAATAAEVKPAHHIVHHPPAESKDGGNLTVVSLGGGLKSAAKAPVVSAATKALLGEMAALISHAAEDVDDNGASRKHGRGKKGGGKKKAGGAASTKHRKAGKHKRHGSDEGGSSAALSSTTSNAAAGLLDRDLEQRRLNLESESSSMQSSRSNALRRLESVPFDPLSRFSSAPIVGADGSVNYALLDPSIAALVKPRLGVQPSGTWRSREEEDALIGAELSPLEGDASRVHSTAAAAVEARRLAREADRRARRAARLAKGYDDLEFSNSEADSDELAEEEERRIREAELRALEDEELRNPLPLHSKRVDTPSGSSVGSASRPSSRELHPALPSFPIASAVAMAVATETAAKPLDVEAAVAAALSDDSQTKGKRSSAGKDAATAASAAASSQAEFDALLSNVDEAPSDSAPIAAGSPRSAADRSSASVFASGLPDAASPARTKSLSSQRTMGGGFARKKSSLGGNEAAMVAMAKKGAAPASAATTVVERADPEEQTDPAAESDAAALAEPKAKRMSAVTEKRLAKRAAAAAAAPLPPVAVPAATAAAPRDSSPSPSRGIAHSIVDENSAWFAHMSSLGRDDILGAALAHAEEAAARAEEEAQRSGLELPPEKSGEATVLATDVEVARDSSDDTHDLRAVNVSQAASSEAAKGTEVVAPLRALRATSAGRSRTKLREAGAEESVVTERPQTQEQRITDLADSIATRMEQAADARFTRPAIVDPTTAAIATPSTSGAAQTPRSPMYAPALTVAAPGIVALAQSSSPSLRSPSLSTHSSRAVSRRPSVLTPGTAVVVSGEDLRGVLVVEPASLNASLLSPAASSSPTRTPRDGDSPIVGAFGTHTAQRRADRLNKEAAATANDREPSEAEAVHGESPNALIRDLARAAHPKRDSTSSGSEFDFVAAAAAAAASSSVSEQQNDAEVSATQRDSASADVPPAATDSSSNKETASSSAPTQPSSTPLPDDWADQVDSFFNAPAAAAAPTAAAIEEPECAASGPLTTADLASSVPPTPRSAAVIVIPTGVPSNSGSAAPSTRVSGQPSPRDPAAAAVAQNKYSTAFCNSLTTPPPAPTAIPQSQPSLTESPSSLLSTAITSTREALHSLSSYHGPPSGRAGSLSGNHVLPLEVSREILRAIQALRPVESLPLAPTLRPASAAPTKVATRGKRSGATTRPQSRDSAMPAAPMDAAQGAVSLHELEDLGLSLESLLSRSRPSGRRTVPVGQVRLLGALPSSSSSNAHAAAAWRSGSASGGVGLNPSAQTLAAIEAAQARERAALKRGPDEAHAIISANLSAAQALHSARGAPPFGGLDVHQYATTSDKAERAAAGSATVSREASPVRHVAFAPNTAVAATAQSRPPIGANSFKLPTSPRAAGGNRRASSGLAGIQTSPRSGSDASSAPVVVGSTTLAASDPQLKPFTSLSAFAATAALIPVPSAPRPHEVVHLSSGEVLQGWQEQEAPQQQQQHTQRRTDKRPTQHAEENASRPAASTSAGGFDLSAGVNAAFDSSASVEAAPPAASVAVSSAIESGGVWNHASTLADEFEWHMPSSAARLPMQGRRGRRGQQQQQSLDAPIPIRKVAQSASDPVAFSPREYSRALRMVVDRSRLAEAQQQQQQQVALAAAQEQTRIQQQQPQHHLASSMSPDRLVDSLFTADGQIKGWHSSFEEEKQNTAAPAAATNTTTMMMLANGGLQHISLSVAATPSPYSTLSPYLPPVAAAAASASASVAASPAFPHEIHSSKFAALTASFNAHPGASSVFGLHSARPKTAERWQTSREGPAATMPAAAVSGASTARPASSLHLNPVHGQPRALIHRGHTGVRTGAHAHAHYSRPSTSHASLMLTPAAPASFASDSLPPPPAMRSAAGVGGGWMFSASVPSIPRSRSDLLTSHGVDSVDPGFKPRNSFVIPATQHTNNSASGSGGVHAALVSSAAPDRNSSVGSHWHASAVRAIPAPELSRFTYAPPFHAMHGTNTPSSGYIHAAHPSQPQPQPHMHALGPHEAMHAYPTANVYVGSHTARGARSSAAAASYAASKSGSLSARRRGRDSDDADLSVSSVSAFYPPPS